MAGKKKRSFKVEPNSQTKEQIRALADKAGSAEVREKLFDALRIIHHRLTNEPMEWGDPEFQTKKAGGLVYHVVCPPLYVRYVAYELEHVVVVLGIKPLPGSEFE